MVAGKIHATDWSVKRAGENYRRGRKRLGRERIKEVYLDLVARGCHTFT